MKLADLAHAIGAQCVGDGSEVVTSVASLQHGMPGSISFLTSQKYLKLLKQTRVSAVIMTDEFQADAPTTMLLVDNPEYAFVQAIGLLNPQQSSPPSIHPSAVIGERCQIDPTVSVAAGCVIGHGVSLGKNVVISANTVIEDNVIVSDNTCVSSNVTICRNTRIGAHCTIHAGVVIGSDGFGYTQHQGQWVKVPQLGRVLIGDYVDIGANTTIDCGALDDTVIETGVKIDNQVQVAHNVSIGAHTVIAGCVGIAGSTQIGEGCMIGGGVCISGHLTIASRSVITGMAMVTKSIKHPGVYSSGTGLQASADWRRSAVHFQKLDQLVKRVQKIERSSDV